MSGKSEFLGKLRFAPKPKIGQRRTVNIGFSRVRQRPKSGFQQIV